VGYRNGRRPRSVPLLSCGFRTGPDSPVRSRRAFESHLPRRRASSSDARTSGRFQEVGRLGTTMPVTRDSPSIQGDVSGPDPARASPSKAVAGRGSLVGGSRRGLPCQARSAMRRAAAPASGVLGPRLVHAPSDPSGSQQSPAVSSGSSFGQVAGAILRKQARGQNPDKDEVPGSSPGSPANHSRSSRPPGRSSTVVLAARLPRFMPPTSRSPRTQWCDDPHAGLNPRPDGDARNAREQGRPNR
jgi:hypothetical protein